MEAIRTKSNAPTITANKNATVGEPDGTFDRALKLVPAQVVAGYTALLAIAEAISTQSLRVALPVAIVSCVALIVLALRSVSTNDREVPPLQYTFSIGAFLAWAFAIKDPLAPFGIATPSWVPAFACVLIPLFGSYLIDAIEN